MADGTNAAETTISRLANANGFRGEIAISLGGEEDIQSRAFGPRATDQLWPWASVTKQVVATLAMQQVGMGKMSLDEPVGRYVPRLAGSSVTWRELLQHRSPLPNPDEAGSSGDWPAFYTSDLPSTLDWCTSTLGEPPETGYSYNNCDYIVLGAALEIVTGHSLEKLVSDMVAGPAGLTGTRFLGGGDTLEFASSDELYRKILPRYGAAGGLVGPLSDMVRFDQALLAKRLLSDEPLQAMWTGDPELGYMALGQWAFAAPLAGCSGDVRIVERRGAIGKYQIRNLILPDSGIIVAMATEQGEDIFSFGEVWSGNGFTFDILSAVACQ